MIEMWHGGRRWLDKPEVQACKAGRYECGPGIYLTNRYLRARDYAKAGGVTTLVKLKEDVRWLEHTELPLSSMEAYVRETPRFRQRERLLADLARSAEHLGRETLPASYLVNLCVNHELLSGQQGVLLSQWLAEQGVDASLHKLNVQEHWVIILNPRVIAQYTVVRAAAVTLEQYDLPLVKQECLVR